MTRLWVDVTDLLDWHGPPTGIPRVVQHMVVRFSALPDASFFAFHHGTFRAVLPADLLHDEEPQGRPRDPSRFDVERAVGVGPLRILRRLPLPVRHWLRRALVVARSTTRFRIENPAATGRRLAIGGVGPGSSPRHPFGRGDQVLVLGHGWHDPSMQQALARARIRTGFRLHQLLYDTVPVDFPQFYGGGFAAEYMRYLFEALRSSDGLLAISETTRGDALKFCDELLIPRPEIRVIRLGDEPVALAARAAEAPAPSEPYILSVGTIEARKNHLLLYQTWKLAQRQAIDLPRLVLVGRPGWGASDLIYALRTDPSVARRIEIRDRVDDLTLRQLYDRCLFTIYPSVYEGWGLPVAESLARGKLCLAADTPAVRELAGDIIEYFSPYSASECLDRVRRYLDPARLRAAELAIEEQYRVTTWAAAFDQLRAHLASYRARGSF